MPKTKSEKNVRLSCFSALELEFNFSVETRQTVTNQFLLESQKRSNFFARRKMASNSCPLILCNPIITVLYRICNVEIHIFKGIVCYHALLRPSFKTLFWEIVLMFKMDFSIFFLSFLRNLVNKHRIEFEITLI